MRKVILRVRENNASRKIVKEKTFTNSESLNDYLIELYKEYYGKHSYFIEVNLMIDDRLYCPWTLGSDIKEVMPIFIDWLKKEVK